MRIRNLTIGYKNKVVVRNINAELKTGRLTCLVGRNGVGKSTLLRTLAGVQKPLASDGAPVEGVSSKGRACDVAVVLTGRPDVQLMKVREIVGLGRSPYTNMWGTLTADDKAVVDDCMQKVGISELAERRIGSLSDGECQKVMIAKALAQQTKVIILDEPTAFLDYPSKAEVMRLLKRVAQDGVAILLSTHDLEMALALADELWLMTSDHRLVCGNRSELDDVLCEELDLKNQYTI